MKGLCMYRFNGDNLEWFDSQGKEHVNELRRKRRHASGESKKYSAGYGGVTLSEEERRHRKKMNSQKYKAMRRGGGLLLTSVIQSVYEDNIKFFGSLTCVYCLKHITFGDDTLDHRTPISKGGSNNYENFVISCSNCNNRKYDKSWNEFFWGKG